MYAIREGRAFINRVPVKTFERETLGANTNVRIEVGTTGFRGSKDRRNGGRTYINLECVNGDFYFVPIINKKKRVVGIEIAVCGDAGLKAIKKMFEFATSTINNQCHKVND